MELTDQTLLEQFVTQKQESAFQAILERHGPMVLGMCRRLLPHSQDADDAFQATFVALAQKASSIRDAKTLGSWLYRVACNSAYEIGRKTSVRIQKESEAIDMLDLHSNMIHLQHMIQI